MECSRIYDLVLAKDVLPAELENDLTQCFSNHGSPRLCGWVAKACKLPHVKEKHLRTQDLRSEEPS